jgi:D-alanyl-lipoteichoic acid acyltransferase DltB (MBOAT superfamily)
VAFFPHLVAGPIMRAKNLLVQVEQPRVWDATRARHGVVLVMWGLFKKLVVADNVGIIANRVFSQSDPAFEVLWAGVFAFGMQIYADFSAYSDIARGVARWLGFELVVNFNHPYIAHSPGDFWRRWHISLSTWFRDYVYIPLGGNRQPAFVAACTLITTFLVSGFWHGASWNYVIWGFYHGVLVWSTREIGRWLKLPEYWPGPLALVQVALTFTAMMAGWLFFRETDADYLGHFLRLSPRVTMQGEAAVGLHFFVLAATWSLPLFLHDLWALARERGIAPITWIESRLTGLRLAGVQAAGVGLLATLTLVLRSTTSLDFIYFAF